MVILQTRKAYCLDFLLGLLDLNEFRSGKKNPEERSDLEAVKTELTKLQNNSTYRKAHVNKYLSVKNGQTEWLRSTDGLDIEQTKVFHYTRQQGSLDMYLLEKQYSSLKYSAEFLNKLERLNQIRAEG